MYINASRLHRFYADNENLTDKTGRLAQLDRALVSGTRGREFKSRIARQLYSIPYVTFSPSGRNSQNNFQPSFQPLPLTAFAANSNQKKPAEVSLIFTVFFGHGKWVGS